MPLTGPAQLRPDRHSCAGPSSGMLRQARGGVAPVGYRLVRWHGLGSLESPPLPLRA